MISTINERKARRKAQCHPKRFKFLDNRGGGMLALPQGIFLCRRNDKTRSPQVSRKRLQFELIAPEGDTYPNHEVVLARPKRSRSMYRPHEGKKQIEKRLKRAALHASNDY
jgi:hypothetical protein